ncbi:MAG TPA: hypothetical protein VFT81_04320 [Dermatophilaceae bacterium]|nr:hypothetical protein [Dermatophilaceae bacterium]
MPADAPWYAALPPLGEAPSPRWRTDEFREELRAWVEGEVGVLTAMEQVHLRPWSTVWRLESAQGVFFAKQNCPLQAFEARLMGTLARRAPSRIVPVTAVDADRGLLLTPDQGVVLGDKMSDDDVTSWTSLVVAAMRLQRELADHTPELLDAGLARLRTQEAAAYVEARTASLAALPPDDPRRLAPEALEPIQALAPRIAEWIEQVEALGLPDALVHNDLHAYNVFGEPSPSPTADTGLRFFDFGDALLMQPLAALLIPLNVMAHRLEAFGGDPRLWRVADAALEVWSDLAPAGELRAALPAALQLGRLGRVESWTRVCATMTDEEYAEYGDAAAAWLDTLRLDPPTGWDAPPR